MISVFTLLYEIHNCSSESETPSIPAPVIDESMLTIIKMDMINDFDHQLDFWWDCAQVRGFWGTLDFASSEKYSALLWSMTTKTTFLSFIMTGSILSAIFSSEWKRPVCWQSYLLRGRASHSTEVEPKKSPSFRLEGKPGKTLYTYMIIEKNKNRLPRSA